MMCEIGHMRFWNAFAALIGAMLAYLMIRYVIQPTFRWIDNRSRRERP